MREFVAWDLEKEHGDLGLASRNSRKPPLSVLGSILRHGRTNDATQELLEHIVGAAQGNIAIAKLNLDLIHQEQTLETLETVHDRLPGNLIALFDAGMKQIEDQPDSQRELGLEAIAAASEVFDGVEFDALERRLLPDTSNPNSEGMPLQVLKDVLRAAKGFLVLKHTEGVVAAYNANFQSYVTEDYNQTLFWARGQLRREGIRRSSTIDSLLSPTTTDDESVAMHINRPEHLAGAITFAKDATFGGSKGKNVFTLSRTFTGTSLGSTGRSWNKRPSVPINS